MNRAHAPSGSFLFTGFPGFIGMRLLPRLLELKPEARASASCRRSSSDPPSSRSRPPGGRLSAPPRTHLSRARGHHRPGARHRGERGAGAPRGAGRGLPPGGGLRPRGRARAGPPHQRARNEARPRVPRGGEAASIACTTSRPPTSRARARAPFARPTWTSARGSRTTTRRRSSSRRWRSSRAACPGPSTGRVWWWATRAPARPASSTGPTSSCGRWSGCPRRASSSGSARADGTVNVVPVDFVVEALARLSAAEVSRGKTYHLTDPAPHGPVEIAQMFAKGLGKRFAYVPVPLRWRRPCSRPGPVRRFFGMPAEALDYFDDAVRHDATQATADLRALGLECPSLADYVPAARGFLSPQAGRGAAGGDDLAPWEEWSVHIPHAAPPSEPLTPSRTGATFRPGGKIRWPSFRSSRGPAAVSTS